VLHDKIASCSKPIFPILPSVIQAAEEVSSFHAMGHVNFADEVSFGYVLSRVNRLHAPYPEVKRVSLDVPTIGEIIDHSGSGFLKDNEVFKLLMAAGIPVIKQAVVDALQQATAQSIAIGFPLVMKVSGPVHKSDVGGVVLNIQSPEAVKETFTKLMNIEGAAAVIMQQQASGIEIYIGAKKESPFGHLLLCGLGGVFVEVFKDVSFGLIPLGEEEANSMISRLKSSPIIQGTRGREGVNTELIVDVMLKISALLEIAPEITELDINPLLGRNDQLIAVDARIRLG